MKSLLFAGRPLLRSTKFPVHAITRNPAMSSSKINDPLTTFAIALKRSQRPGCRPRYGSSKYRMRVVQMGGTPGVNVMAIRSDNVRISSGLSNLRPCWAQLEFAFVEDVTLQLSF